MDALNTLYPSLPTNLKAMDALQLNQAVGTSTIPDELTAAIANNAGGHWNHCFFWRVSAHAAWSLPAMEAGIPPYYLFS